MDDKSLITLIKELLKCEDLTIKEHKSLPIISDVLPSNDRFANERTVAYLPIKEVERILQLARRYLYPPQRLTREKDTLEPSGLQSEQLNLRGSDYGHRDPVG